MGAWDGDAWGSGSQFNTDYTGSTQGGVWSQIATVQTTDATETTAMTITPGAGRECIYDIWVIAESDTTAGEGASYHLVGGFHDVAGTMQLNGTGTVDAYEHSGVAAGMDCVVDTNGATIRVRVTGEASHTLNWKVWAKVYSHAA